MKWLIIILGVFILLCFVRKSSNSAKEETTPPTPEPVTVIIPPKQTPKPEDAHPSFSDIVAAAESKRIKGTGSTEADPELIREKKRIPSPDHER